MNTTWTWAPRAASLAMRPPHPSTSSSAWGAITRARETRSSSGIVAHVPVRAVERDGLLDQRVEVDRRLPARRARGLEHRQLVDRRGLLVELAVDLLAVDEVDA